MTALDRATRPPFDAGVVKAFAARRCSARPSEIRLHVRPFRDGLEQQVARVSAFTGPRRDLFVAKRLPRDSSEVDAYRRLRGLGLSGLAPRVLGVNRTLGHVYLYLEYVTRWSQWPWRDTAFAGAVLEAVAAVHAAGARAGTPMPSWNYEAALHASAAATIDSVERAASRWPTTALRRGATAVRRLASALPRVRECLAADEQVFIHGDLHPGNVRITSTAGRKRVVLLDWGRSRCGSPYEDVASWLQSLGYWEPHARRDHDRLMRQYLSARGRVGAATRDQRDRYWLAAGCNALSGALRYHLECALSAGDACPDARDRGLHAATDWLRVTRRAADRLPRRRAACASHHLHRHTRRARSDRTL